MDYFNTYSPLVSWNTDILVLGMALINDCHMKFIDFVLAFPQAPVKTDIYIKPPKVPKDFKNPKFTEIELLLRFHIKVN